MAKKHINSPFPHTGRDEKILKFIQDGASYRAIGLIFGISKTRVMQIFRKARKKVKT